jgi:hypothetical protein
MGSGVIVAIVSSTLFVFELGGHVFLPDLNHCPLFRIKLLIVHIDPPVYLSSVDSTGHPRKPASFRVAGW